MEILVLYFPIPILMIYIFVGGSILNGRLKICARPENNAFIDDDNENGDADYADQEDYDQQIPNERLRLCQIMKIKVVDNWAAYNSCGPGECLPSYLKMVKQVSSNYAIHASIIIIITRLCCPPAMTTSTGGRQSLAVLVFCTMVCTPPVV